MSCVGHGYGDVLVVERLADDLAALVRDVPPKPLKPLKLRITSSATSPRLRLRFGFNQASTADSSSAAVWRSP